MVEKSDKPASKTTAKKTAVGKKSAENSNTKKVGGGTRFNPVTAERLRMAEDVIKSKSVKSKSPESQATIDLKKRAAEAKKRAQKKILEKGYVSDPADPLERLANTFDNSARRWEMVVYPSMFAFILLAGYGFYLIYHLTNDISVLSKNVSHMSYIVSDAMPKMSKDLSGMTGSINNMTGDITHMSRDVSGMAKGISKMSDQMTTLRPMNANLASMTQTMSSMDRSVHGMNRHVGNLNRTVSSGPFGMMNDMMPFSSSSYQPQRIPPPRYVPPAIAPPPNFIAKPKNSGRPIRNSAPAVPAIIKR